MTGRRAAAGTVAAVLAIGSVLLPWRAGPLLAEQAYVPASGEAHLTASGTPYQESGGQIVPRGPAASASIDFVLDLASVGPAGRSFTFHEKAVDPSRASTLLLSSRPGSTGWEWDLTAIIRGATDVPSIACGTTNGPENHLTLTTTRDDADGVEGEFTCDKAASYVGQPTFATAKGSFRVSFTPSETNDVDVAVDHIEVIQVIQDRGNTVPLVADKHTVARVFLRLSGGPAPRTLDVEVELYGLRGGATAQPRLPKVRGTFTIRQQPDRRAAAESPTFALPSTWTGAGSLGLQATVSVLPPGNETRPDDNDYVETFQFDLRRGLQIAYVGLCMRWDDVAHKKADCPGDLSAWASPQAGANVEALFPVPDGSVQIFKLPGDPWLSPVPLKKHADGGALLAWLEESFLYARAWSAEIGRQPDQWIAVAPGAIINKTGYGGASNGQHSAYLQEGSATSFGIAHEMGHNHGLSHQQTTDGSPECTTAPPPFDPGPPILDEVGYDPGHVFRGVGETIVPASTFDFMSYCGPSQWINVGHYRTLMRTLPQRGAGGLGDPQRLAQAGLQAGVAAAAGPMELIIRGTVRSDGSGGSLLPAFSVPADPSAPSGDPSSSGPACLQSWSAAGMVAERCFDVQFTAPETAVATDEASFVEVIPDPGDLIRVALTLGGREVAALAAGGSATVNVDNHRGETWRDTQTIRWAGGGASTRTSVLYSPDGGRLWLPFAADVTDGELTIDPTTLIAGSSGMFRVLVTNGLHTAFTDIGPINVPASVGRPPLPTRDEAPPALPAAPTPTEGSSAAPTLDPLQPAGEGSPGLLIGLLLIVLAGAGAVILFVVVRPRSVRSAGATTVAGVAQYSPPGTAAPTPPPAVSAAWRPTHFVPTDGIPAWQTPDPTTAPTPLAPSLPVQVVEVRGDWARVVCSNGWVGWVDGRRLLPAG